MDIILTYILCACQINPDTCFISYCPMPYPQNTADRADHVITQLVTRYHTRLVKKAALLVGEKLAEDIVQDAWVSLLQSWEAIRNPDAVFTWLSRVIFTRSLNSLKKENRMHSLERIYSSEPVFNGYPADSFTSVADAPETGVLLQQKLLKTREQWQALPVKQKTACTLRFVHGYSYEQIAQVLDVSLSNSKVLLHRGKTTLLKTLKDN